MEAPAPAPALAPRQDRAVLEPLNNMRKWPITPALHNFLNSIGLGYITTLDYPLRVDRCLVNILVNHYDVDQTCFIFNGSRFYFSLVDVQIITGLRVDGKPVLGRLGLRDNMCQTAFGLTPPADAFEKAKIKFSWLLQEFAGLQVAEGDPLWLPYLKAFFLYFIGSFIIPDATTGVVSVQYLSLMDDMQAIGDYAWGAAAWATMHGCLQRRKINGLSYALMIFAIEHIRPLRDELIGQVELPMELQLMLSWPPILRKVLNGDTTRKRGRYIVIVDNLVEAECIRHPYERLDLAEYGGQLARACSETLCINFLEIYPHTPNNHHTQFGFASIDPASARGLPTVVVPIKRKGPTPKVDLAADERFTAYKDARLGRRPLRGQLQDDWALPPWMMDNIEELNQQTPPQSPPFNISTTTNATLDDLSPALHGYDTNDTDDHDLNHVYETDDPDPDPDHGDGIDDHGDGTNDPDPDHCHDPALTLVYQRRKRMPRVDGANANPSIDIPLGPTVHHMHLRSVINRNGLKRNRGSLVYNEKSLQESEDESAMNIMKSEVFVNEVKVVRNKERRPSMVSIVGNQNPSTRLSNTVECGSSISLFEKQECASSSSLFVKQECTSSGSLFVEQESASPSISDEDTFANIKKAERLEKRVPLIKALIWGSKGKRKLKTARKSRSSSLFEKQEDGSSNPSFRKRVSELNTKIKRLAYVVQVLKENTFGRSLPFGS